MSEMVERVARAIRDKVAEIEQRPGVHDADAMFFADEYARAAIAAMREPTPETIEAARAIWIEWEISDEDDLPAMIIKRIFRAMIDEMLK